MSRSAYNVQQDLALTSGLRSEIIWDSLSPDQADVLKQKITNLIFQNTENETKIVNKRRQQVFDNVWKQRKYTNRILHSAIIYVLVTAETDPELALKSTNFTCHPVIRTRKCLREDCGSSDGCCMIFVDEHGRVYANWREYVEHNILPKGTMIAPTQGIYTFTNDDENGALLMVTLTPASRINRQMLKAGDGMATLSGLVASVPVAAALVTPIAPPVLLAATIVCVTTSAYSAARSVKNLFDRRQHKQSTSLLNREARGSWLAAAGGVVGLSAIGAVNALTIAGTEVNAAAQLAVKGINVSAVVISGTGVAHGVYDIYLKIRDDQPVLGVDLLEISSSLIIFTHSVNNLHIVNEVTNGSTFRSALSNQTGKVFAQIAQESAKLNKDTDNTRFDILRILNDIPIKATLLKMLEILKHLFQGTSPGAEILLSNLMSMDNDGQMRLKEEQLSKMFGSKFVQHIGNPSSLMDVLIAMATYFTEQAVQLLMKFTSNFLEQNVDDFNRTLKSFISTETVLYRILMHCISNYKSFTFEFLEQRHDDILAAVFQYFQSLQPLNAQNCCKVKCPDCIGCYYLCDL